MKLKRVISVLAAAMMLTTAVPGYAIIESDQKADYVWDTVRIGGGGLVTGLHYHPLEKDLIYARTDVGGAYRWDEEQNIWIQLHDKFSRQESNLY